MEEITIHVENGIGSESKELSKWLGRGTYTVKAEIMEPKYRSWEIAVWRKEDQTELNPTWRQTELVCNKEYEFKYRVTSRSWYMEFKAWSEGGARTCDLIMHIEGLIFSRDL